MKFMQRGAEKAAAKTDARAAARAATAARWTAAGAAAPTGCVLVRQGEPRPATVARRSFGPGKPVEGAVAGESAADGADTADAVMAAVLAGGPLSSGGGKRKGGLPWGKGKGGKGGVAKPAKKKKK
jgi:hypothetical protein